MMNNIKVFECPQIKEKYYFYTHPSGLDIYFFPKKMTASYAIFGTKYGSLDNCFKRECDKEFVNVPDGIAHFLEHKLFECEDGSDAFERFSDCGADANAYTSFNKTAYLFSATDNFQKALYELLDFVTHPYFSEKSVSKEQGIIAQEIKMYDDSPSDRCFYGMLEGMYEHHSVRRNICGTVESISKITPELLYDCYNTFYNLSNMALAVSGDLDIDKIIEVADSALKEKAEPVRIVRSDENSKEKRGVRTPLVEQKMNVSKPIFCIGIKDTDIPSDPTARQRKDAVMSMLDEMLFSRCSDLYNDLLERQIITPSFSYGYTISSSFAYNSLAGEADDPKLVQKELFDYLEKVKREGLSRSDFERAKRVMYAEYVKLFDSTESIANTLLGFICDDSDIFEYNDILRSVSFEEINEAFENSFDKECFTLSTVYPI